MARMRNEILIEWTEGSCKGEINLLYHWNVCVKPRGTAPLPRVKKSVSTYLHSDCPWYKPASNKVQKLCKHLQDLGTIRTLRRMRIKWRKTRQNVPTPWSRSCFVGMPPVVILGWEEVVPCSYQRASKSFAKEPALNVSHAYSCVSDVADLLLLVRLFRAVVYSCLCVGIFYFSSIKF